MLNETTRPATSPLRKVVRRETVSRGARHDHLACGHYVAARRYARELPYCRCPFCGKGGAA